MLDNNNYYLRLGYLTDCSTTLHVMDVVEIFQVLLYFMSFGFIKFKIHIQYIVIVYNSLIYLYTILL